MSITTRLVLRAKNYAGAGNQHESLQELLKQAARYRNTISPGIVFNVVSCVIHMPSNYWSRPSNTTWINCIKLYNFVILSNWEPLLAGIVMMQLSWWKRQLLTFGWDPAQPSMNPLSMSDNAMDDMDDMEY